MRRLWHDIRTHQLAAVLFGLFWLTTAIIIVVVWPQGLPDPGGWLPLVVMALCAGALVAWWRNAEVEALGVSAVAGALIGALHLGIQDVAYTVERWLANSPAVVVAVEPSADEEPGWLFIAVLIIIIGVIGGLLGALGWGMALVLMRAVRWLRGRGEPAAPTGVA